MYSDDEKVVLCGASAYEQKYYFNQDFASLPQSVQDELHIMCVMFTVEIGGIFTMWFDSDGSLQFETEAVDADAMYDEIGGALRDQAVSGGEKGSAGISGAVLPRFLPRRGSAGGSVRRRRRREAGWKVRNVRSRRCLR